MNTYNWNASHWWFHIAVDVHHLAPGVPLPTSISHPAVKNFFRHFSDNMASVDSDYSPDIVSFFTTDNYITCSILTMLVYDWVICLHEEIRLIWSWRPGINGCSLIYILSRYTLLIQFFANTVLFYPVSESSCRAIGWTAITAEILSIISFAAFSALRAYALSNKNRWLVTIIAILALSRAVGGAVSSATTVFIIIPSPINCVSINSMTSLTFIITSEMTGGLRVMSELLVLTITWWYTYQSYRILKAAINLRRSILSILAYNGSIYFICLATCYILQVTPVPLELQEIIDPFADPIISIIVCRFILSMRRFDRGPSSEVESSGRNVEWLQATRPGLKRRLQGQRASTSAILQFSALPNETLPAFIGSFGNPVHVNELELEIEDMELEEIRPRIASVVH